jgi:hypothetical protein
MAGLAVAALLSLAPALAGQAAPPSLRPDGPPLVAGMRVLAGSLHDHSTDSDGDTTSAAIAAWELKHHFELGLDFGILSDHSDAYPVALGASTSGNPADAAVAASGTPWARQGALTVADSKDGFSLLRGFEVTNDQENHLNVIGSQNWVARTQAGEGALTMLPFYRWISTAPVPDPGGNGLGYGGADGSGQFNHPSSKGALNWDDYSYNAAAAPFMDTIEIFGDQNPASPGHSDAGWYWFALSKGWTVGPVMDWDYHHWTSDGIVTAATPGSECAGRAHLPCARSLVVAPVSTPAAIYAALRQRRTGATERPDLWATLRGPAGEWQGATVGGGPGTTITLTVDAGTSTDPLASIDIVSDNGVSAYPYYYGDNDPCNPAASSLPTDTIAACTGTGQLALSYAEQHRRYVTSGGMATRKGMIDTAPPSTVVATVKLGAGETRRATRRIRVTVPAAASARPDGRHFFYAVAHTTAARAWTAPILTDAAVAPDPEPAAGSTVPAPESSPPGSGLPSTGRGLGLQMVLLLALLVALGAASLARIRN